MSFHWCDNLHTAVFSPRDYQVELLAAAFERNTMICLGHKSSKEFIALKLIQESAHLTCSQRSKISIYLTVSSRSAMFNMLQHLTDLNVYQESPDSTENVDVPLHHQVYILHPKRCLQLLIEEKIKMENINLLVIEDCHHDFVQSDIIDIFTNYYKTRDIKYMPKVLGLAGPLHSASCALAELSAMLNTLETTVQCKTETASDIVTVLRYCSKPFEYIIQCAPYKQSELCFLLQDILLTRKAFLTNHRYDPFEIYSTDEFLEELEDIPDPKKEPLEFLDIMLQVLLEMGPWSADRVAFNVYQRIEKQKIKTPHERHYILLCLVNTALLEVHAICEQHFRKFKNNHKDCVENYSSPKVLRLLEVLRLFKPDDNTSKNDTMKRISIELDTMDFQKLTRILETKCHSVEQAVEKQQLESRSIVENLDSIIKPEFHNKINNEKLNCEKIVENKTKNNNSKTDDTNISSNPHSSSATNRRQSTAHNNNRPKRRPFRRHRDQYDASDTLCSIIFCNSNYTARVLFELLAEMSRHDSSLKFIKCQFTTDRVADPITEPKEAESEHRRQEEVLKRFRMHDCNILIGTSVLEEGIDVPKCNLVIRWDPPTTYRSYVQCKGKARAVPAYHVLLVAPNYNEFAHLAASNEQINDKSHILVCNLEESDENLTSDLEYSENEEHNSAGEEESRQINGVSMKQKFVYGSSKGTIKILNPEVITYKHPSKVSAKSSSNLILKEIEDESFDITNIKDNFISKDIEQKYSNTNNISNKSINCNKSVIDASCCMHNIVDMEEIKDKSNSQNKTEKNISIKDSEYNIIDNDGALRDSSDKQNVSLKNTEYNVLDIDEALRARTNKNIPLKNSDHNVFDIDESLSDSGDKNVLSKNIKYVFDTDEALHENTDKIILSKQSENNVFDINDALRHSMETNVFPKNSEYVFDINNAFRKSTDKNISSKNSEYNVIDIDCRTDKNSSSKNSEHNVLDIDDALRDIDNKSKKIEEARSVQKSKAQKKFLCLLHDNNELDPQISNTRTKQFENMNNTTNTIVQQMAEYREIEKMLLQKCANVEPEEIEHRDADIFNNCIEPYKPLARLLTGAFVDLSNSIALVNKYCAKLPSDTFTKLTPLWRCSHTTRNNIIMYQYTIRLPINSPLKYDIVGLPMPTKVLARRMAALQVCIVLHKSGELDDNLQPIGKEGFKAIESDWENFELEDEDEKIVMENSEPRPGTTKRRQYYYKRIASEFCDCRPVAGEQCYLYLLDLTLQCPIPEEQNTRGRKIYPPEDALQGFGILTLKKIPKVSSFPIFTRSGEVNVSLVLHPQRVVLNEKQISCINAFINYTFSKVLRLKKFLMLFDPESTENCVFIVPTLKESSGNKSIDWKFLEHIEQNANMMPTPVPEEKRHAEEFSSEKFNDAVVMPWYRNQDQPHYFYVAEICHQLSPMSAFPSKKYRTFMHYYYIKYGLKIHSKQPLLDVDHTSARLNFLTPRYVNRKGVALPTSSEATKRAKRENLELKQILVPELCTVHPFPASLWRTAVCLPCILYRINGLLLADDIRKKVVRDMGLGYNELTEDKEWPMLDFGWSLSDVLKKTKVNKLKSVDNNENNEEQTKTEKSLNDTENLADLLKAEKQDNNSLDTECKNRDLSSDFVEIGTWSNEMADNLEYQFSDLDTDEEDFDEVLDGLMMVNYTISDKATRATSPTFTDIQLDETEDFRQTQTTKAKKQEQGFAYYDSDTSYDESFFDSDVDIIDNTESSDEDDIVITSKNEAETIETEQDIEKLNKQLSIIQASKANDRDYHETKNLQVGYNFQDIKHGISDELKKSVQQFEESINNFIYDIRNSGMLVEYDSNVKLPEKTKETNKKINKLELCRETYKQFIPYISDGDLSNLLPDEEIAKHALSIDTLQSFNIKWVRNHPYELYRIDGCGDLFDNFNDSNNLVLAETGEKLIRIDFENQGKEYCKEKLMQDFKNEYSKNLKHFPAENFSFDYQPDLSTHPGPSPSIILQALTMSNANDGINLERLETIGDSFLKYAITTYLYITYENVHEGKLSHLRSKQVANLNLYRLGRRKQLGEYMIATKFEPSDNWLPPCYYVPKELEKALIEAKIPPHYWSLVDLVNIKKLTNAEICELVRKKADEWGCNFSEQNDFEDDNHASSTVLNDWDDPNCVPAEFSCFIPYNLVSQHSIPDKSVADCVEALIGAYLIECGLRGALLFMAWLGIRVIPCKRVPYDCKKTRMPGTTLPDNDGMITVFGSWDPPKSPLLHYTPNAEETLNAMLEGYDELEKRLGYKFRDRSYLLQAMTHASYTPNRLTDCYQRLEFLGDAVLDYLITRHLYEDPRQHSPGALTDLRSALVNNTIFASLAVRHGFHKYFRHLSPGLNEVIDRFVRIQTENGHSISEEYYLLSEEECDDAEDVEVPKALGDVFESVAGAIFLDSNMSLDAVWLVYYNMMRPEIEQFSNSVPKSPIRELLELEPETAKFGKPEKLADGRRVRVTVEVFCKGTYRGIGRNYRIAKCTAAKCALRQLKKKGLIEKRI